MASEPKTTLLLNDWFSLLTFKLLKKSRVFKLRIILYGKGIQRHSNHSPQLFEFEGKKKQQKNNKKKKQQQVTLFCGIVATHNTFT